MTAIIAFLRGQPVVLLFLILGLGYQAAGPASGVNATASADSVSMRLSTA